MIHATDSCVNADVDRATLTSQIEALVARVHPIVSLERRHDDRIAVPVLFRLTPLDADHQPIDQETSIVVGKNISRRGLSFYHEQPIQYRRALVELAELGLGTFSAEIDVSWCRFTRPGWYESGGRLIRCLAQNTPRQTGTRPPSVMPTPVLVQPSCSFALSTPCQI